MNAAHLQLCGAPSSQTCWIWVVICNSCRCNIICTAVKAGSWSPGSKGGQPTNGNHLGWTNLLVILCRWASRSRRRPLWDRDRQSGGDHGVQRWWRLGEDIGKREKTDMQTQDQLPFGGGLKWDTEQKIKRCFPGIVGLLDSSYECGGCDLHCPVFTVKLTGGFNGKQKWCNDRF